MKINGSLTEVGACKTYYLDLSWSFKNIIGICLLYYVTTTTEPSYSSNDIDYFSSLLTFKTFLCSKDATGRENIFPRRNFFFATKTKRAKPPIKASKK